jgi:peptide deformylase
MPVRPCLPWPHKSLRTPAVPVDAITDDIRAIWDDMIDTMVAMPGVGLAAPQIGVGLSLAIVSAAGTREGTIRLANPVLLGASVELREHDEASPNLPGVWARLKRPAQVWVRYLDTSGETVEREFSGLAATSVQHQLDHLAGRMYFDNLSPLKRKMLLAKAEKRGRE